MARPRKPEGALVAAGTRLSEPTRDRLDEIAATKAVSRSALIAQVLTRYVEDYPLDDD